jgi:hypothetical protein
VLGSLAPAGGAAWFGLLNMRPLGLTSLRALTRNPEVAFTAQGSLRGRPDRRAHLFVYSSRK